MQSIVRYCRKLITYRVAIFGLAGRSFKSRFVGTGGGLIWSIVLPLATVFSYWMVFSLGFKAKGPNGIPFDVYFMTAFLPWSFLTDALNASTNSVVGNRHLVKKMVFPTEALPLVEIISSTFGHLIFLVLTLVLLLLHGFVPGWGMLQLAYAYLCTVALALGLGWLLAALNVFHRDIGQSLSVILSFWFWATPIVWSVEMLPANWRLFLNFNPAYHIVESYRDALLYDKPVWQDLSQQYIFWITVLMLGLFGGYVFRRLKPEFADVL
jgi:ABC-type polysaccharide/polyol phosphate export permease